MAHCSVMWWLIVRKCGGLFLGDVVAHYWRCGGSLMDMWWLIVGYFYVLAHCSEMWWLIVGYVVADC